MHAPQDSTELLAAIWRQNDLLLHQQHFIITQLETLMSAKQDILDAVAETKTVTDTVQVGVNTLLGIIRSGALSQADAAEILQAIKDRNADIASTNVNPDSPDTDPSAL